MTFVVHGDSVIGQVQRTSTTATGQPGKPRALKGTLRGYQLELETAPIGSIRTDGLDTGLQIQDLYSLELRGNELVGTYFPKSTDGSTRGAVRQFRAIRK